MIGRRSSDPACTGRRRGTPPGPGAVRARAPGREPPRSGSRSPRDSRWAGWPTGSADGSRESRWQEPSDDVAERQGRTRSRAREAQPPRVCISRRGSCLSPSIWIRTPRCPIASRSFRSSAPRSRRRLQPLVISARSSSRDAPSRSGVRRSMPRSSVETEIPRAVRRQPAPVARPAERRRGRGDDPERRAVGQPEALGGRGALLADRLDRPYRSRQLARSISARDTTCVARPVGRPAHVHVLDEPHLGADPARRTPARSISSSSLTPRMTTVSSLSPANPACRTASMPAQHAACSSRRVSARKRSGRRVSRLTVTRWRPAARRAAA